MGIDAQTHGDHRESDDEVGAGEDRVLDDEPGEDDRGQPAGSEPAHELNRDRP